MFKKYRYSAEIIVHAVYMYYRCSLIYRDIEDILNDIHENLYNEAKTYLEQNVTDVSSTEELEKFFNNKENIGFARMDVSVLENPALEPIMTKHALTPRCIPFEDEGEKVLIGKSY